jgi:hypothetical protein
MYTLLHASTAFELCNDGGAVLSLSLTEQDGATQASVWVQRRGGLIARHLEGRRLLRRLGTLAP